MVEYGWDQTPTPDLGLDITKAPEDIQKLYKWVIQKTYGEDVASAYAQGLVAAGIIAKNAEALSLFTSGKMDELKVFVDGMLLEMTDKDVISAPEIIQARGGKTTLGERLDETTAKLAQTTRRIRLSSLGLGQSGDDNLTKILSELTSDNVCFVVDGVYKLSCSVTRVVDFDLHFEGEEGGTFIFENDNDVPFFNVRKNVLVEGITFINETEQMKWIFLDELNRSIDFVRIVGNGFDGNFRLVNFTNLKKIREVDVLSNNISNTKNSFFQISGVDIDVANFKFNKVHNWFYRMFNIGGRGDTVVKEINCESNYASNDPEWIFNDIAPEATYYVFALIEGTIVNYRRNVVKNMKAITPVRVYDCYGGGEYTNYEFNEFENNICIDNSVTNVLMKPKSENSTKRYIGNSFKIEETAIAQLGGNTSDFNVKLYDIWGGDSENPHSLPVSITMRDNRVEVPNLVLEIAPRFVREFVYSNNYISVQTMVNSLVNTRSKDSIINIENNIFDIASDTQRYFLVSIGLGEGDKCRSIKVVDNEFNKGFNQLVVASSDMLIIENNTIDTNSASDQRLANYGSHTNTLMSNNSYIGAGGKSAFSNFGIVGQMDSFNKGRIKDASIYIHTMDRSVNRKISIKVVKGDVLSIFTVEVLTTGKFKFYDTNGVARESSILSSEANGISVRNDGDGGSTLNIHNNSSMTRLTVSSDFADSMVELYVSVV